jgi:hypothetical protein
MSLEDSTPEPGDSTPKPQGDPKPASPSGSRTQGSQRSTTRGRTGQGRLPASPPVREQAPEHASGPTDEPQSYQTFKLQFLLDERNAVRRTEITHVESGEKKTLRAYDREGLLAVLDAYVRPAAEHHDVAAQDSKESAIPADAVDETPTPDVGEDGRAGAEALEAAMVTFQSPPSTLEVGKPATLCLTIDFGSARAPGESAPDYKYHALISAKPVHGGPWQKIGTSSGSLTAQATTAIEVPVAPGPPGGLYQLEGTISLRDPISGRPYRLLSVGEPSMLQVNTATTAGSVT